MIKEDLINEVFRRMKEITVYKDGYRNTFDVGIDDVFWYMEGFDIVKYKIFMKLKKYEIFSMSLGDAYFCINNQPCCCKISQINHPKAGYRDNHEMIIIIELNRLNLNRYSVISDFYKFFQKYDGPVFEDIKEIQSRFEILDL